jgi:hypothetical protein
MQRAKFFTIFAVIPSLGPIRSLISIPRHLLFIYFKMTVNVNGARGGAVVKALRYKPAGRGFDSRWCHWNFSVT